MPYSEVFFDKKIEKLIQKWGYSSYFDIGIGAGKYGEIIKKIYPNAKLKGIEIDSEYINKFNLSEIYDEIIHGDIKDYINKNSGSMTDVVIVGDIIEHLLKSEGVDLLNYLIFTKKGGTYETHFCFVHCTRYGSLPGCGFRTGTN